MESWRLILSSVRPRAFVVEAEDVSVYATEAYGVVTCMEVVDADESVGRYSGQQSHRGDAHYHLTEL